MTPEQLFQALAKNEMPAALQLQGQDAYLTRELKILLKKKNIEISFRSLKDKGPGTEDEEEAAGTSLFSAQKVLWLECLAAPSRWSAASKKIFERLKTAADGQSLWFILQRPTSSGKKDDSSSKTDSSLTQVAWDLEPAQYLPWIKRMNDQRGKTLDEKRLRFLEARSAEVDLLQVDQWMELWSLGGDYWAEEALGFAPDAAHSGAAVSSWLRDNPAYVWVESVCAGKKDLAAKALQELQRKEQEALPLLALLTKSLKIMAALERGEDTAGEAPFLVDKVKRSWQQARVRDPLRAQKLLHVCAEADTWLKSRPVDSGALLLKISLAD